MFEKLSSLPSILDFFDLNNFSVQNLIDFLLEANLPDLASLLKSIVSKIAEALLNIDFGFLDKLLPSNLRQLFKNIFDEFPDFNTLDNLLYSLRSGTL